MYRREKDISFGYIDFSDRSYIDGKGPKRLDEGFPKASEINIYYSRLNDLVIVINYIIKK